MRWTWRKGRLLFRVGRRDGLSVAPAVPDYVEDQPVHTFFGLTYSAYLCVPRLVLQEMPVAWQRELVALLLQLPPTPAYSCQRRDDAGRYITDPLAEYRRGKLPPSIAAHIRNLP